MIALIGMLLGAIVGWITATRRGGNTPDKLQYAFGFAVAFGLVAFFIGMFAVKFGVA